MQNLESFSNKHVQTNLTTQQIKKRLNNTLEWKRRGQFACHKSKLADKDNCEAGGVLIFSNRFFPNNSL